MIDRRALVAAVRGILVTAITGPRAKSPAQSVPKQIAFLTTFPRADVEVAAGLIRAELERPGWIVGRNIVMLEPKTSTGRNEPLPSMAAALVAQGLDLILSQTLPPRAR